MATKEQARPQPPSPILRCQLTNNPCGTDTLPKGTVCLCVYCCESRAAEPPERTPPTWHQMCEIAAQKLCNRCFIGRTRYKAIWPEVAPPEVKKERYLHDANDVCSADDFLREMDKEFGTLLARAVAVPETPDSECSTGHGYSGLCDRWTVAPIPPPPPQKLDFIVVAHGYCSIDKEGVIALENGKTQSECLRFIFDEMNKSMRENSDRCEREKKHILDVWESTIPKFPKTTKKHAAPERGDSK